MAKNKERQIPMSEVLWADCTNIEKERNCLFPVILNKDNNKFMEISPKHYNEIIKLSDKKLHTEEAYDLICAYYSKVTGARKVEILDTLEAVTNYYPIRMREALLLNGRSKISRKVLGAGHAFSKKTPSEIYKFSSLLNGVKVKDLPPFTNDETKNITAENFVDLREQEGTKVVGVTKLMKDDHSMGD